MFKNFYRKIKEKRFYKQILKNTEKEYLLCSFRIWNREQDLKNLENINYNGIENKEIDEMKKDIEEKKQKLIKEQNNDESQRANVVLIISRLKEYIKKI